MEQFNKKLSKSGSITLPAAMRRSSFGIDSGERFRISVNNEGSIVLKRIQGECVFCKSDVDLIAHAGRFVCSGCLRMMNEKTREG
ncbi:Antidote-toxin recognition MazE, antitoxin [Desulfotomaculum arcticum]|uniref:Antidote-toxin recognition MazE, antitoxin n=1 Tax=Desulfotruncus arcticus DSM 17038 TaxID=1121424 RepID=A0A1I2Y8T7_9FIRM|nr:AbrB/MazE/SpoVT family DNA-binding domain-containing protein [Desulfotruncus arcticus]SFH21769.1 Antidote-toxin recognition MazE, antitoxin [Desulfotomaculum arcticum] [Desulfotruncus arcticus DSM 17038]